MTVYYVRNWEKLRQVKNGLFDFDGVFYDMTKAFATYSQDLLIRTVFDIGTPLIEHTDGKLYRMSTGAARQRIREYHKLYGACFAGFHYEHGLSIELFLQKYEEAMDFEQIPPSRLSKEDVRDWDLAMAIASNSSSRLIHRMLQSFDLAEVIHEKGVKVIGCDTIDYLTKPDPGAYKAIMTQLDDWKPDETITADDSLKNLQVASEQFGLMSALILHGREFDTSRVPVYVDVVVDTLPDLFKVVAAAKAAAPQPTSSCLSNHLSAGRDCRPVVR